MQSSTDNLVRLTFLGFMVLWILVVSALLFGAYHLSPLDGMYRTFWQFPISQFLASAFIGVIWGYLYSKRGYETAVLGHTFSDWVPILFFLR